MPISQLYFHQFINTNTNSHAIQFPQAYKYDFHSPYNILGLTNYTNIKFKQIKNLLLFTPSFQHLLSLDSKTESKLFPNHLNHKLELTHTSNLDMPKGLFPGRSSLLQIFMATFIINIVRSQVTWTDFTQIRASQTSIYDDAYIPLNVVSQVSITFKTAFPAASTIAHRALVISGFENYLHYQMKMNVTINSAFINMFTVDIYVGLQTYVKQMNVNYFFVITDPSFDPFFFVSTGNYRTLDLDSENDPLYPGLRPQQFVNQTVPTPYVDPGVIISAIYAIDYKNTEGVINDVQIKTWMNPTQNILRQKVTVDEKGILYYASITTIIIRASFYSNPNTYQEIAKTFETSITPIDATLGIFDGFDVFYKIDRALLFDQTQNSLYFGISGFRFTMEDTRLFLLQIATTLSPIVFSSNLQTNPFMKQVKLSVLIFVKRECTVLSEYYYVEGYECRVNCTNLLDDLTVAPKLVCKDCSTLCVNGCVGTIFQCNQCAGGNNRVAASNPSLPHLCICPGGYFDDGTDVCKYCLDSMPGCLACNSVDHCNNCGAFVGNLIGSPNMGCRCTDPAKFLVIRNSTCLDFPGCIQTNIYINAEFCQLCDDSNVSNFNSTPDLNDNRICKCLPGYALNGTTNRCEDDCGDSKTLNQIDACDDGNLQSGDGCSSTCKVQYGYVCTVEIFGGLSKCAQKQQITITYLYTQKNLIANQATLVFSLLPEQHLLAATTFQNSVTLNVNGNKKIRFDPITSFIYITIDYTTPLQGKQLQVNFTFNGLKISSPDINLEFTLSGHNAKISATDKLQQTAIIIYVGLAVSGFSLLLALLSSFLGEKIIGIQLILPVQAAFFTMSTFPKNIYSPISALWSLKFSNGYNILTSYDLSTNYMLDNRAAMMQYTGQYILNYNIMFLLLAAVILIIGLIAIRIAWLQRQQRNLQALQKKKQDEEKLAQPKKKKQKAKQKVSQNQKDGTNQKGNENQSTEEQTQKQDEMDMQNITEDLQDTRQNIKNWKNFMYMIFDRFFSILVITAMSKVIFCFYLQLSNLAYTAQIYDNSLNAGFFFLTYATIVTGLYAIVYDYKTDKLIVFTCNKGKYAIMYIFTFAGYIIILGALFETGISAYIAVVFAIIPLVLIPYQVPYGMTLIGFQNIIAFICQLPFLIAVAVSVMLNIQGQSIDEPICIILAYVIIGSTGLTSILTIIRLIKVIDCKKVSCFQFTDRKKQNANDKNKKKNKVMLLQLDMDKEVDEFSEDSVRAVLFQRKKNEKADDFSIQITNKQGHEVQAKKDDLKKQDKQKEKKINDEDDDEEIDELEKIKIKLRKQLKQKKAIGKIK